MDAQLAERRERISVLNEQEKAQSAELDALRKQSAEQEQQRTQAEQALRQAEQAQRRQESQLCAGAFLFCRKSEFLNPRKGQKG